MSFGGGGRAGGGGSSTSTTSAEFPPEFRPLARTAVEQIQELQRALPLVGFAQPQPAQVAGLSPFLLEALRLASLTPATTPAERALGELTFPIQQTVAQIPRFTEPTAASGAALRALAPRLGGGSLAPGPVQNPVQDLLALLTGSVGANVPVVPGTSTAFGAGGPFTPLPTSAEFPPELRPLISW